MCMNAFAKINKTNPNLFFFVLESGAPGKAGQSSGISSIKNVTLKLRPGYYKPHCTFVSSSSQNEKKKKITYFSVVSAEAGTNYNSYIISYVNVFAFFDLPM